MEIEPKFNHDSPSKSEKKWIHYAVEFFMLFLAVTLGFVTENLRQHNEENERAREMAIGLYDDLKKDSAKIQEVIGRNDLFILEMNSLIKTLSSKDIKSKISMLTFYQASFLLEVDMPIPSRANLDQLKNSGSLRYFKNKKLVTNISQWDNIISAEFEQRQRTDQQRLIEEIKAVSRVFYPVILDSMRTISFENFYSYRKIGEGILEQFEKEPAQLITYDKTSINEVIGWASERKKNAYVRSTYFLPLQLDNIKQLMTELNEEFDIKKNVK